MSEQVLSAALELIIHQALKLNTNKTTKRHLLTNKQLVVSLKELSFALSFTVIELQGQQTIRVGTLNDETDKSNADCHIRTSVKTLQQLKQKQPLTTLIKQDQLAIDGDIKVAQHFVDYVENIDIDWQSELAKHLGDIPTYKLSQLFEGMANKVNFAAKQIPADASEWLLHEQRLIVTLSELTTFHQQVNQTAIATKQLTDKIELLSAKIASLSKQN